MDCGMTDLSLRRSLGRLRGISRLGNGEATQPKGGGWYDPAALWQADYENSRFKLGSTIYDNEAAFLTAIGGTATTIGPYAVPGGTNLVSNGDASSGTTGWTVNNGALFSVVSGEFVLDGNGATAPSVSQLLTMDTANYKAYKFSATGRRGTTGTSGFLSAMQGVSSGTKVSGNNVINSTSPITTSMTLGAESSTYINFQLAGTGVTGTAIVDDLAAVEAVPYAGFTSGQLAATIRFETPAAASGNKVIAQWGDDSERNRVRLVWGSDTHLHAIVTMANTERANLDLGAISTNTEKTVEISMGNNQFAARLVGGTTLVDPSVLIPGIAKYWRKRSPTGETFDGTIKEMRVYAQARAQADLIVGFGDSYVPDTNGVGLISSINSAGRPAVSYGQGGTTLAQQVAVFEANPLLHRGITVHWDGSCNGYGTLEEDMALYGRLTTGGRFVFSTPLRRANADSGYNAAALALHDAMLTAWPSNVIDAQALLASHASSPGDDANLAANYTALSLMQVDETHLNATGMAYSAAAIVSLVNGLGW